MDGLEKKLAIVFTRTLQLTWKSVQLLQFPLPIKILALAYQSCQQIQIEGNERRAEPESNFCTLANLFIQPASVSYPA